MEIGNNNFNEMQEFNQIKIYHIVHINRLQSIVNDGYLWSDSKIAEQQASGTNIGMNHIKEQRLNKELMTYPEVKIGQCVPFYFCPRSVMLYLIYRGNHPQLNYRDGQDHIIHLEAKLCEVIKWAEKNNQRYVFTLSNAASRYAEDYSDIEDLKRIDWEAVNARDWQDKREEKQAEFLIENNFSLQLINKIGVFNDNILTSVSSILQGHEPKPSIEIERDWYY